MLNTLVRLPADGPPDLLYLLFHGQGQDEEAMRPLAMALAGEYPQAAVLCLRAPHAADPPPGRPRGFGYQYFSRIALTDENRIERMLVEVPGFVARVRALQQEFGIGWERTALCGFSQGGIMSLESVQREPHLAGRVLAFGARHSVVPEQPPVDTTVHFFHGMADPVISFRFAVDSAELLLAMGADVTADIVPGVGHEVHPLLVEKALEQLRTFLPRRVWREVMSEAPVIPRPASSRELD